MLHPGFEAAFHLDDGNAGGGELDCGGGGEFACLAVAIDDRRALLRETGKRVPLALRQIDRSRDVAGLVVAWQTHIDDRDGLLAFDLAVEFERTGDEGKFLRKVVARLAGILSRHDEHLGLQYGHCVRASEALRY